MTIEEFVEDISVVSDERRLIENPYRDGRRKNHLLQYLRHLERSGVDVMLVGEAPGYRGCTLTGIPFTDEFQLKLPANIYALGAWERSGGIGNTSERSASAVWAALREYHIIPLMWNAFPFHPYQEGKIASNRTPAQSELKEGLWYLDALRSIFSIKDSQVFAVGKKAKEILGVTSDSHYIRHPANDFKREFRPQFDLKIGKPYGRRPGDTLRHTTGEADAPERMKGGSGYDSPTLVS